MEPQQFDIFMNFMAERFAPQVAEPRLHREDEGRVNWSNLPKLDVAIATEVDYWFQFFEGRMEAGRVPEEHWAARFFECPMVDASVKADLRNIDTPQDYCSLRLRILAQYGPTDPVNFYKSELYEVKGSSREDIRRSLTRLLALHNRAARDNGVQEMSQRDLCYPFMKAFPASIRGRLEEQFSIIFAHKDPFDHLVRMAPKTVLSQTDCLHCALENNNISETGNENEQTREVAVALPMQGITSQFSQPAKKRRMQGQFTCQGCGGSCRDRRSCPAFDKECLFCRRRGHFAAVCRAKRNGPKAPFQRSPAQSQ